MKHTTWSKNVMQMCCRKKAPRFFASVAQLVEQGFCKPQVVSSNLIASSRQIKG